jgi:UDP-N-acetylglucosamine pyrophosphorylase
LSESTFRSNAVLDSAIFCERQGASRRFLPFKFKPTASALPLTSRPIPVAFETRVFPIMPQLSSSLIQCLDNHDQSHLIRHWNELDETQQRNLQQQLDAVDFAMLRQAWHDAKRTIDPTENEVSRAERAEAPRSVIRQPESVKELAQWIQAVNHGNALLSANQCAVITVAGGQGTRLGFDRPKGMFPVGPVTDRSLFRIFAEQIAAIRMQHACRLDWLIMTSNATHKDTVAFFEQHKFFGLPRETVSFFCQASLPAMDAATGKVLMSDTSSLSLAPDGHGGMVSALHESGLLAKLAADKVEHLYYHQIDNPTAKLCDPAFMGFHDLEQSSLTTLVVRKISPAERMGVLAHVDGHTEIIEYSELTLEQAGKKDESGQWMFWAGSMAIHAFSRSFLQELVEDGYGLPLHAALKKVPWADETGTIVTPSDDDPPNAIKLERFIFDALPLARNTLIVEADRLREFNPIKNADGADSPATARAALSRIGRRMLELAGADVPDDRPVEISPLVVFDEQQLKARLESGDIKVEDFM